MSNKFEKLISYIINEDDAKAKALFHQIVVEHSRKIYEDLEAEELGGEDLGDDVTAHDDAIEGDEAGLDDASTDDLDADLDTESEDDSGLEDRVMDLEDALDELKAEFDDLLAQEEDEGHDFDKESTDLDDSDIDTDADTDADLDDDVNDESDLDEDDETEEDEEPVDESFHRKTSADLMREYVEKVNNPAKSSESSRSPVAGKNDFGGTSKNIAQGGRESNQDSGPRAPTNAYAKGRTEVPHAGKFQNVAGGKKNLERVTRSESQ